MREREATERFLDAAVRPLEDNAGMQVGARHELAEVISRGEVPSAATRRRGEWRRRSDGEG